MMTVECTYHSKSVLLSVSKRQEFWEIFKVFQSPVLYIQVMNHVMEPFFHLFVDAQSRIRVMQILHICVVHTAWLGIESAIIYCD